MMKDILTPPPNASLSRSGYTWLNEDGIIIALATAHEVHSLEDAIENTRINEALAAGIRRPFLIDLTKVKTMSREARAFYAGPEPQKSITAVALLTGSNIGKMVANFFIGLAKPTLPTRMFTNIEEAYNWAKQHKSS